MLGIVCMGEDCDGRRPGSEPALEPGRSKPGSEPLLLEGSVSEPRSESIGLALMPL